MLLGRKKCFTPRNGSVQFPGTVPAVPGRPVLARPHSTRVKQVKLSNNEDRHFYKTTNNNESNRHAIIVQSSAQPVVDSGSGAPTPPASEKTNAAAEATQMDTEKKMTSTRGTMSALEYYSKQETSTMTPRVEATGPSGGQFDYVVVSGLKRQLFPQWTLVAAPLEVLRTKLMRSLEILGQTVRSKLQQLQRGTQRMRHTVGVTDLKKADELSPFNMNCRLLRGLRIAKMKTFIFSYRPTLSECNQS